LDALGKNPFSLNQFLALFNVSPCAPAAHDKHLLFHLVVLGPLLPPKRIPSATRLTSGLGAGGCGQSSY
jgi:hypothetical protein